MGRGRPPGQMTHRRQQVLDEFYNCAMRGERVSLAALARKCGLHDYRDARRILTDLRKMGAVR